MVRLEFVVLHAQIDVSAMTAVGIDVELYASEVLLHNCNYLGFDEVVLIGDNIVLLSLQR